MAVISFDVSREDHKLLIEIVDRAQRTIHRLDLPGLGKRQDLLMDLTAVHANGCPLRLRELLDADDFNFNHDVFGIFRAIDRRTGQLRNCFVPRFAA